MILSTKQALRAAVPALVLLAVAGLAHAAAPNITYTATGTFASPPASGTDTLKLAGEPFTVTITVNAATAPYKTGPNWAAYNALHLTGEVNSGLVGPTPIGIASGEASIQQALDPNKFDQFVLQAPIKVVGIDLVIKAIIQMPWGTLKNQLLHPFNAVTLSPTNATMSYSDGTSTTTLGIQSGTLTAIIPTGASAVHIIGAAHK